MRGHIGQITAGGRREGFTARPARVGPRVGMTLVELLVAMTILLVGVWAVAKGFPALMGAITADQQRTQLARMVEGRMEALRQAAWTLPQAFAMYPLNQTASLDPDSKPRDPDTYDPNNPNSRDDFTVVLGEWGKIPAPQTNSPYVFMPVMHGLLDTDPGRQGAVFACFIAERLEPMNFLPPGGSIPAGRFFLDWAGANVGRVWVPSGYDVVRVDYGWVDTGGTTHWVQGDVLLLLGGATTADVAARSAPSFASVLPGSARCIGLKAVPLVTGTQPNPGEVCIEPTCGAGLIFNAADAGKAVLVSYRLRSNPDGSRALYLMEEYNMGELTAQPVSGAPDERWVTVRLGWGGLDKLMDITQGAQTVPVHVLAVDEVAGDVYYDGTGVEPLDSEALRTGQIRLRVSTSALGHKFRFFYKTLDQGAIVVYKPPTIFYESIVPSVAALPFQTYAAATSGAGVTSLRFSASNIGHTVAVDYVYDADPGPAVKPTMVCGELHTLGPSSTGAEAVCTLSHPGVLEIRAVRGVSVRLRAWWRTPTGRLATYDLETILPPAEAI